MRNFNVRIPNKLQADTASLNRNRLERHFENEISVMTIKDGVISEIMCIRFYQVHGSLTRRCCLWIRDAYTGITTHGVHAGSSASGWGYDKQSETLQRALRAVGIEHDCNISGIQVDYELIRQVIKVLDPDIDYIHFHIANA